MKIFSHEYAMDLIVIELLSSVLFPMRFNMNLISNIFSCHHEIFFKVIFSSFLILLSCLHLRIMRIAYNNVTLITWRAKTTLRNILDILSLLSHTKSQT